MEENREAAAQPVASEQRTSQPDGGFLRIGQDRAAALVVLDRPAALNALSTAMYDAIAQALPRWTRDPEVYAVVIASANERAFCAGGDAREIAELGRSNMAGARAGFAGGYAACWALDCFMKPTVSLIDGVVMGGGVGISLYGTHRVAGERYRLAMPEANIGLFPDQGVCWAFARLPEEYGMYLALTGRAVGRAEAHRLGLATHCIPAARFGEIRAALADAQPVDQVLDALHVDPGAGDPEPVRAAIARCFRGATVEAILGALQEESGSVRDWAKGVLDDLRQRSPTSLKITHRLVRMARDLDLRETLRLDYRLACRCLEDSDFYEGVDARLITRDRAPAWRPASLEDVSEARIDTYFSAQGMDDLALQSRAQMQAFKR